jgi:D-serine deaminase-like pyridoxal phosphate-dependent protein
MSNYFNRRKFLQASAFAGAASLWSPSLSAETFIDVKSSDIGKSKWDLDSPALCVDLDKMEKNIKHVHTRLQGTGTGVRPHFKTHKCPDIAKMQIAAGAVGICAAKLSESEVLLLNGIQNVLMTGVNISVSKINHAMALRKKHKGFIQAVDNMQNARDLQDAAKAAGIIADIVVDLDVIKRSGIANGQPALELAQYVDKAPNLKFHGVLAYDGAVQHVEGFKRRKEQAFKTFEPVVGSFELMKKSGLNTEIFSGGGTGTYDMMYEIPGFTDVQVGSYLFMDHQYMIIGGANNEKVFDDFAPSLTVMATIINDAKEGKYVTDSGAKALTLNVPRGKIIGEPDFEYNAGSDEYGSVKIVNPSKKYKVGDKFEVIVPHCDPVVNLYDFMYGIRNGKVEKILPILARGKSQ